MKENQFDFVAPIYDWLASIVFGTKLFKAQVFHLAEIKEDDRVLIVGGGTGKILHDKAFARAHSIDYTELSKKMIERAKAQAEGLSKINFIQKDFFEHEGEYDFIVCNFFLDCFDEEHLGVAIERLSGLLSQNGTLLVTDFKPTDNKKNTLLVHLMLVFFRLTSSLQTRKLQNIPKALSRNFKLIQNREFKNGLIFSSLFKSNVEPKGDRS